MHYMMILKASAACETGRQPTGATRAAIWQYTQELRKAGALVELSRLYPSSRGARVKLSKGNHTVTDGPFAETKELIGGYWIIEAKSMNEAIQWAKRVPAGGGDSEETEVEIRQFVELEEFVPYETAEAAPVAAKEFAKAQNQF